MNTNTKTPNTMKYALNNPNNALGGEEIMPGTLHAGGEEIMPGTLHAGGEEIMPGTLHAGGEEIMPGTLHAGGEEIMPGTLHAGGGGTQADGPPTDLDEDLNWLLTELPRWNDGWGEKWASEAPDAYTYGKYFGGVERDQTMRARRFSGVFGPTPTFLHFRGADAYAAFYG